MDAYKLFMVLMGCCPPGRHTEQHDIFFGIARHLPDLLPAMDAFWPEARGKFHLDAWRIVTHVDGYNVTVQERAVAGSAAQLFFINLGGYKPGEFEEFHYKMLVAAPDKGVAIQQAKQTAFYRHTGFKGATSHVDDKYGIDVDDIFAIADVLPAAVKAQYQIILTPATTQPPPDEIHLGYFTPEKIRKGLW